MESFHWDRQFETGLIEVDQQHRRLVDLINRFGDLITTIDPAAAPKIESGFRELAAYADYHFREEEQLMLGHALDARHVERHRKEHAHFMHEVDRMHESVSARDPDALRPLLNFLATWLAYHILGSDQVMAAQIHDIESGHPPAAAYATAQRRKVNPTEPLLKALNGLFEQVSERNRELLELNRTLEDRVAERTRALAEANGSLSELVRKLEAEKVESRRLAEQLAQANRHLEALAMTDVLTNLPNRRRAMECMARMWEAARTAGRPLSCMLIDADGFKQINDTWGHDAGDQVLRRLAQELRDRVHTDDVAARLGGDEFMIICPDTPLHGALRLAESVRAGVASLEVPAGGGAWQGSISVGVAADAPQMGSVSDLVEAADRGVYLAKHRGRNCVASVQLQSPASHPA